MPKLGMLRHDQSIWNQENKFAGRTDVGHSKKVVQEAWAANAKVK